MVKGKKSTSQDPVVTAGLYEKVILTLHNSLIHYWTTPSYLAIFLKIIGDQHQNFICEIIF